MVLSIDDHPWHLLLYAQSSIYEVLHELSPREQVSWVINYLKFNGKIDPSRGVSTWLFNTFLSEK